MFSSDKIIFNNKMHEIYDAVTTHMRTVYTFCIQKLNIKDVYN